MNVARAVRFAHGWLATWLVLPVGVSCEPPPRPPAPASAVSPHPEPVAEGPDAWSLRKGEREEERLGVRVVDADGATIVDAAEALDGWLDPKGRWLVTVEGVGGDLALRWRELPSGKVVQTESGAHAVLVREAGLGFVGRLTITKQVTITAFELAARTEVVVLDHVAPFGPHANLDFDFVVSKDGAKVGWVDAHPHVYDIATRKLESSEGGAWTEPLGFTERGRLCVTPRVFLPTVTEPPGTVAHCFTSEEEPLPGPRYRRRLAVMVMLPVVAGQDVLTRFRATGATSDGPTWCRQEDLVAYLEVAHAAPPRDRGHVVVVERSGKLRGRKEIVHPEIDRHVTLRFERGCGEVVVTVHGKDHRFSTTDMSPR